MKNDNGAARRCWHRVQVSPQFARMRKRQSGGSRYCIGIGGIEQLVLLNEEQCAQSEVGQQHEEQQEAGQAAEPQGAHVVSGRGGWRTVLQAKIKREGEPSLFDHVQKPYFA
ncbi:MAG TPA: hypothetical protein PLW86_12535, partial [Rhodocyclaceae bacterium]|nr:hypothetical protein [Rhodocyclaceae bacterium]